MPPSIASAWPTARDKVPRSTGPTRTPARNGPWRAWCAHTGRSCRSRSPRPRPSRPSRPSITALTTQWACMNSAISDTSAETSGKEMTEPRRRDSSAVSSQRKCPYSLREQKAAGSTAARQARRFSPARKPHLVSHGGPAESRALLPLPTCQNKGYPRVIPSLTKR